MRVFTLCIRMRNVSMATARHSRCALNEVAAMREAAEVNTGRQSSLPLQIVVYFSGWYLVLFYPALLAALLYKGSCTVYCLAKRGTNVAANVAPRALHRCWVVSYQGGCV